jgi:hypothetical protein
MEGEVWLGEGLVILRAHGAGDIGGPGESGRFIKRV